MRSLDHVAIAVPGLEEAIRRFAEDLGLTLDGVEDVAPAQTRTAFFPVTELGRSTRIELVAPLEGGGPIARALATRGPGLHHLAFRSDDLDADAARLKERGYVFVGEGPSPGAHGTRTLFLHPRSTGGVLIELVEYPSEATHG